MLGFVIGDNDMVTGFRLVGVEGTEVNSQNEAQKALGQALMRNDLGIILISQELSSEPQLHSAIDTVRRERVSPLILEVPSSRAKPTETRISDLISKTLGVKM